LRSDSRILGFLLVAVLGTAVLGLAVAGRWLDVVMVLQTSPLQPLPSSDILGDYLTGVVWAVLLAGAVALWGAAVRFKEPLFLAWLAKAFVALVFMLFYDFRYGVDPDGYFLNASSAGFEWQGFELGQGTRNTQMLAWLHIQALSSSYHATRLTFALLGLVAVYLTYRAGVILIGREDRRVFYFLALTPSMLFWSSILGKDPVALFAVSAYVYGVVGWYKREQARYLAWVVVGVGVGIFIRLWLAPILLIPLTILGWTGKGGVARKVACLALGVAGIAAAPAVIRETIGVETVRQDEVLETTNYLARSFEPGGSTLAVPDMAGLGDVAVFAPLGGFTVLFRPFPGEIPNLFGMIAGLENVFFLLLALRAVWRTRLRDFRDPLVLWALATVALWAFVYAFGSYQNLGTSIRHRLQIMPLQLGLLLYLGRRRDDVPQTRTDGRNRAPQLARRAR
jgi:hypothetical protein